MAVGALVWRRRKNLSASGISRIGANMETSNSSRETISTADVEATLVHGAQGARSLNLFFL
jgi:hypothetical protein